MNRDNQQEIGLVGWLAGIIDGEGTVALSISRRAKRSQMIRTTPEVMIGNTDPLIIERCIKAFEVIGVGHYARHERRPGGMVCGTMVKKFKPVTMLEVSGIQRTRTLLNAVRPFLAGEKAMRADLLLKFINGRIGYVADSKKARNVAYRQEDIDNALAFLRVTKTKNLDGIAKILNEHTREARTKTPETRAKMAAAKKLYWDNWRSAKMCSELARDSETPQK